jgi:hypothetical protein
MALLILNYITLWLIEIVFHAKQLKQLILFFSLGSH